MVGVSVHPIIRLAVIFITGGILLWIVGSVLQARERKSAGASMDTKGRLESALYLLTCLAWCVTDIYFTLPTRAHTQGQTALVSIHAVGGIMTDVDSYVNSLTADPILRFLIEAPPGIIGLLLIPGIIVLYLLIAAFFVSLFVLSVLIYPLILLARVSITGAIVVAILGSIPIALLIRVVNRNYKAQIARALWRIIEPIYGVFFDWWLYPLLQRRKEKKLMDNIKKKRARAEGAIGKLERPDLPPAVTLPSASPDHSLIKQIAERFRLRGQQKTNQEKIKLASQAKQYLTETRGAIDAYRGVLEAQDDLERVEEGDFAEERDDEAEIRRLDRKKRKLTLEREIADFDPATRKPSKSEHEQKFDVALEKRRLDARHKATEEFHGVRELRELRRIRDEHLEFAKNDETMTDDELTSEVAFIKQLYSDAFDRLTKGDKRGIFER